ncbi:MAG: TIGR03790 family protein [Planctomycetes bacterium]|nr:TIGR03790 family protein [Planctomycetota bacterium]
MKHLLVILAVITLQQLQPLHVRADLKPEEIAILAARGSRGSERLAEYYAEQRGIPTENICSVVMPGGESISHEKWRWAVRPEIRKWLLEHDPQRKLRCLVTTWDVPLRIGRDKKDSPILERYQKYLQGERTKRIKLLRNLVTEFGLLAPGMELTGEEDQESATDAGATPVAEGSAAPAEIKQLQKQLETELQNAQARIRKLTDPQEQQQAAVKLQRYATIVGGIQILLESLQKQIPPDGKVPANIQGEFERMRGMLLAYAELQQRLNRSAPSIERDATLLNTLARTRGIVASVSWIDEQLKIVRKNETNSSFDSELSLVLWPEGYQLLRWQPNYLRPEYDNSQLRDSYPTLMVARLDGPTLPLAKGLIDTAIKIEKQGLEGKVYLDARGIGKLDQSNVKLGSYADYDRALLITAKGLQEQTSLDVTLDTKSELFQPGDCPEAALYCGWYSLGKYVDAFDWSPGAVGYHLASGEATTLRKEGSQVWCKRMLEDGVCATLGPAFEPYLVAFPRPNEFFALLIEGDLSLVECYYRTKPFNSWMMTLIGDPLYRPFANRTVRK